MDMDKLLALRTLADEGTQIRAAEKLFCTQSALSKQINTLERELGCSLFDRKGSRLVLNGNGQKVYAYAVLCLSGYEQLQEELAALQEHSARLVYLGTTNSIGVYLLPEVLQKAGSVLPELEIRFTVGFRAKIISLLTDKKVSLAILPRSGEEPPPPGYLAAPLFREEMALVVPPDHPLAGKSAIFQDVSRLPLLVPEKDSATRQFIAALVEKSGTDAARLLDFGNIEAIKQGILRGMGVSILPQATVRRELERGELAQCRIEDVCMERIVDCIYRKNAALTWWERKFLDLFSDQTASY
ncbi:MAG: LysR family transcriptional regulator [Enterocloster asparagiformis]|nr:LysR family transcriptional regulator [Enterocloster asparagiformis]